MGPLPGREGLACLRVLRAGLCSLVVDLGRPHCRSLGVPVGGAADRLALAVGNALVGNPPGAAALEVSGVGPTLVSDASLACVLYGAPFEMKIGGLPWPAGKTFTLRPAEELHVGGTPTGLRAYLCVRGGLQVPTILDSRSGLAPMQAGAELPCLPGVMRPRLLLHSFERGVEAGLFRVIDGVQADWFDMAEFSGQSFMVTPASNRMGLRLAGRPLTLPGREMVSEPVCPGSVQVTHDGQCVVLGIDGQTIGGYPKIAQVIGADLDALGQLRPGDAIRFERVSLEQAEALHRARQAELNAWLTRLRAAEFFPTASEPGRSA
jgi:allophanate hydrolase subunit 2